MNRIYKIVTLLIALCVMASCTKKEAGIPVQSVSLESKTVTVYLGSTKQLSAKVLPETATDKSLSWESQFPAVAAVSSTGEVTGRSLGSTYITVKSNSGSASDICTVTVTEAPVAVTSVSLDKSEISINGTQSVTLKATILPENATNKGITWSSGDTEVAVVSAKGEVSGVDEGTTTITATTNDGGFKASCKVKVTSTRAQKRPSGAGWTKTNVTGADGIVLYTYSGKEPISNQYQYVVVADVDTSKYALKFYMDGSRHITSWVLSKTGGVLSMNAAYETTSIYIKVDGSPKKYIENDQISDTGVANWKNDGGVAIDYAGKIHFLNTIFREADSKGSGSYGLTLEQQRSYYKAHKNMDQYYAVYSSAPMMIDKYKPIGTTFVPSGQTYYNPNNKKSEDPYYHQSHTHPRTVIAMDCKGHLLMLVADGRWTGKAIGFSCKDLTQFLVEHFDPKFALNMDGGGSTDMCVAGMGLSGTHIVNHPYADGTGTWTNPKEREVTSFFYLVKK